MLFLFNGKDLNRFICCWRKGKVVSQRGDDDGWSEISEKI
jgi:hypothetical protein